MNPRSVWRLQCFVGCLFWLLGNQMLRAASLISVTPSNGAVQVLIGSTIQFTFDQPVAYSPSLELIAGADGNGLQGEHLWGVNHVWSEDRKSLVVSRDTSFPVHTRIEWKLEGVRFDEEPTGSLGHEYGGSFVTASPGGVALIGDVLISFRCEATGLQEGEAKPVHWRYHIVNRSSTLTVRSPKSRYLDRVWVEGPGWEAPKEIPVWSGQMDEFRLGPQTNSLELWNLLFPAGQYRITLEAKGSNQVLLVDVPSPPPYPFIKNFTAAQNIDSTKPFTVEVDAGGDPGVAVEFEISDDNGGGYWSSADLQSGEILHGASSGFTLPRGTPPPGNVWLLYGQGEISQTNIQIGAEIRFLWEITSRSRLATIGGSPIQISSAVFWTNRFALEAKVDMGQNYVLERSTNLIDWAGVQGIYGAGWTNSHPDFLQVVDQLFEDQNPSADRRFYRVRKLINQALTQPANKVSEVP